MIMSSCEASIFNLGITLRRLGSGVSSTLAGLHSPNSLPLPTKFVSFSIADGPNSNSSCASEANRGSKRRSGFCNNTVNEEEEDGDGLERPAHCEVEVISWRERRIRAEISVNASVESVWDALTDYERLADFIPNLISSARIPCPHPGRIWLEQRGLQRGLYWQIEARVVLDLLEFPNLADGRELHFSMVDGDFKKFEGKWSIKSMKRSSPTVLIYEVNVIPRFNFPAILLERIIRSDLPVNLLALACRAEKSFCGNKTNGTTENFTGEPSTTNSLNASSCENVEPLAGGLKDIISGSGSGLLAPNSLKLNGNWGVFGKVCDLDKPCKVDEVHLRRFDGLLEDGGVHRCVFASITVKSSVREVWNALTDYERLPEKNLLSAMAATRIVPNLAISKILSRENNRVRILQEGCKGLLYMVLHARVVLDLCEHLEQEISFEQVEGDFDSFQGKWVLEQLGNHHTLLKYSVESKMRKDLFLSEAIMEEVVYEDLPSNLCAIRDYIEKGDEGNLLEANCIKKYSKEPIVSCKFERDDEEITMAEQIFDSNEQAPFKPRPKVPGLQRDFEILKAEVLKFISENGQEGFMPMRKQLRLHGRVDIEKAITRMGGFRRIASMMNLSLAYKHRKPKGYWEKLENLQEEINRFQSSWGMDPSFMPSRKSFERAGRYDIARALEKWGGLHEVSRLLSLKVRHPNRQAGCGKDRKSDNVAFIEGDGDSKTPSKPYIAHDTEKWLIELKHLDIDWVE